MVSPLAKKYIEHFEIIFQMLGFNSVPEGKQPTEQLKRYVTELDRISSPRDFEERFAKLLHDRDQYVYEQYAEADGEAQTKAAPEQPEALNAILDQALMLLEQGVDSSKEANDVVQEIIVKLRKARSINNIRHLSGEVITAGEEMVFNNNAMQNGLGQIAMELAFCQRRIRDLEDELTETRRETRTDHLTGLFNRKAFDKDIRETINRHARFHNPACLLLVDLDNFKQINDKWGHKIGDDVLINFSKLLKGSLREFDLTYRLGGDEFGILFNGACMKTALSVAQRVREYVASHVYIIGDLRFSLSISGGITQLRPDEGAMDWYKRSDEMLYRAKHGGRNKICREENLEEPA